MRTAKATPKPPPGIVEALKSKTAALENATILLKGRFKPVEREPVAPNASGDPDLADECAFDRAYSRWLAALAKWHNPDGMDDETAKKPAEDSKEPSASSSSRRPPYPTWFGRKSSFLDLLGRRTPPWPSG